MLRMKMTILITITFTILIIKNWLLRSQKTLFVEKNDKIQMKIKKASAQLLIRKQGSSIRLRQVLLFHSDIRLSLRIFSTQVFRRMKYYRSRKVQYHSYEVGI